MVARTGMFRTIRAPGRGSGAPSRTRPTMELAPVFPAPVVHVDEPIWRPYAALATLQAADVSLTGFVLAVGGTEQNPLARVLTDLGWPGLALLLIVKLSLVLVLFQRQTRVRLASALYTAVVVNNLLFATLYLWHT